MSIKHKAWEALNLKNAVVISEMTHSDAFPLSVSIMHQTFIHPTLSDHTNS